MKGPLIILKYKGHKAWHQHHKIYREKQLPEAPPQGVAGPDEMHFSKDFNVEDQDQCDHKQLILQLVSCDAVASSDEDK